MFLCTLATKWAKISSIYSKITKVGGMFRDFPAQNHTPCLGISWKKSHHTIFTILGEYPPPGSRTPMLLSGGSRGGGAGGESAAAPPLFLGRFLLFSGAASRNLDSRPPPPLFTDPGSASASNQLAKCRIS